MNEIDMQISSLAKQVFQAIAEENGKVYIVGGTVRDMLMGRESSHDIDVEIYHLSEKQLYNVLSRFGNVKTFGKSFAIYQLGLLPGYDFALPRKERKTGVKHTDFEVEVDPELPLKKAIERRDLTMNALMYDYECHQVIDLCHGQQDIQDKIIRVVNNERFQEDPLRVLRIASFAARFNFSIDQEAKRLCSQMVDEGMLDYLPKERVYQEYSKILLGDHPSTGFYFLHEIGALPDYLENLTTTMQRLDYHPEGDVFTHTMMVVEEGAKVKNQSTAPLDFMWSCLLHDIGKAVVTDSLGHAHGHCEAGVKLFEGIDLIYANKQRKYIEAMIAYHMDYPSITKKKDDYRYRLLLKKLDGKAPFEDLFLITVCDKIGRGRVIWEEITLFYEYYQYLQDHYGTKKAEPLISGGDLTAMKIPNKKKYAIILEDVYDRQLHGEDRESLIQYILKVYGEG